MFPNVEDQDLLNRVCSHHGSHWHHPGGRCPGEKARLNRTAVNPWLLLQENTVAVWGYKPIEYHKQIVVFVPGNNTMRYLESGKIVLHANWKNDWKTTESLTWKISKCGKNRGEKRSSQLQKQVLKEPRQTECLFRRSADQVFKNDAYSFSSETLSLLIRSDDTSSPSASMALTSQNNVINW